MDKARVRIVSDGTAAGTQITIDGQPIEEEVDRVVWTADADGTGRATVEFNYVAVDVVGEQVSP
jgi:hypothetical protein